MSFISTEDLRSEANLGRQTDPALLLPHIESAEIELAKILGSERCGVIERMRDSLNAEERRIFGEVKKGAVYLAMSYAVNSLNMETQGNGMVKIKGWDQSRSELMTPAEIADMRKYLRDTAMLFIEPHIEKPDNGSIETGGFRMEAL